MTLSHLTLGDAAAYVGIALEIISGFSEEHNASVAGNFRAINVGCGFLSTELDVCSLAVVSVARTPISLESLGQVRGQV